MVLRGLASLLLIGAMLFSTFVNAQQLQFQFERLDVDDGLSHHMVNDIYKDSAGFLWFATSSGLNRYDGHSIKVFRSIPGDSSSLIVDDIRRIFPGPDGKLWLYTHTGNCVYDSRTEKFERNTDQLLRKLSIFSGLITFIKKDSIGNFWFVHFNSGLFYHNVSTGKTIRLEHKADDPSTIASMQMAAVEEAPDGNIWILHQNGVFEKLDVSSMKVTFRSEELARRFKYENYEYSLTVDSDGDLWMANDRNYGCFLFRPSSNSMTNYTTTSSPALSSNLVREVVEGEGKRIWIATDHGGINVLHKNENTITRVLHDEDDQHSLSENNINTLYRDNEGIIWSGTFRSGVSYYHEKIFRFQLYRHNTSNPSTLPYPEVNAFAEDKLGNLWIGTNGGGLIYFDRKKNVFKTYKHDPKNLNSLSTDVIVSLYLDHEAILWIGTYYGGLNRFDGKRFTHFRHDASNPRSIGDDSIWEIMEDSNHNLWFGTLKAGISVYNRSKNEFFHYKSGDPNSIHTNYVSSLIEDNAGDMWIGTGYGLEVLQRSSGRFVHYLNDQRNPSSLSNNNVLSVFQDSRGLIWIGTHGGLNLFDKERNGFRAFHEKDGLEHNMILAITEDKKGDLWMSTPTGLTKLIVKKTNGEFSFTFRNYNRNDGLQNGAFHENAVLRCSTGELAFGGSNGFNLFQPSQLSATVSSPTVVFTDLQIFNKRVGINERFDNRVVLPQSITETKSITLGPGSNVFSVEFAALNFFHSSKIRYRYRLDGFNSEWLISNENERKVTFTNLDPGEYVLKVMPSNSEGEWTNAPATLSITILPPFWKTKIAFALYGAFIVGALLLVRWIALKRERIKTRIKYERLEAERMHELDLMKIRFFTNVSHEFRTPLTLILAPVEKLLKTESDPEEKKQFELIHRNARRLLNLVNQLLDFRKVEVQEVKLTTSEGDIVGYVRDLVYSFSDLSEKKNIRLIFQSQIEVLETYFDRDKVEKIIFNLLSNAFKFTPENGEVSVVIDATQREGGNFVVIKVIDTGIGIPLEKQDKIFERFYQAEIPSNLVNQGSGIGLSIVQEFVKVHGGTIEVESSPGRGSCFTVALPANPLSTQKEGTISFDEDVEDEEIDDLVQRQAIGKPVVLLVEDNEDFRSYLRDNLRETYHVIEASNGKLGMQKALAQLPDLIVSDIMMPEVDGIEMCRRLKEDAHTSHIPVILLTARTAQEQKLEGFEAGADDYITKPFNFDILQTRIRNLIAQREAIQKHFPKLLEVKASEIQVTTHDEKLIKNAIEYVEANLTNKAFSVEELSRNLGMSRVLLYKKLLALTGKTPIEFIRAIRLQRAAQLLEKSQYTVSEIAYQVGINNPKYFAKYFKDEYKMLPSAYAAEKRSRKEV